MSSLIHLAIRKVLTLGLFTISISALFQGCYRMPNEGEVSTVPLTNNPSITRQQQSTFLPGMNQ